MNRITKENFAYIVKSRTGKMTGFATEAEAVAEAKRRSNARACFVVYKDGKAIHSFMNKKELTNWVSVYKYVDENRRPGYVPRKGNRDNVSLEHSIDVAPSKVRVCYTNIQYYRHEKGITTKIVKYSVVFHANGRVLVHDAGELKTLDAKHIHLVLSYEERAILIRELIKLRPELDGILNREEVGDWDLAGVFSKPNYYFSVDAFKGIKEYKRFHESFDMFRLYPAKLVNDGEIISYVADKLAVPTTKSFRKIYNENIMNIRITYVIKMFGFKDTNNYAKVACLGLAFMYWIDEGDDLFTKALISIRGENTAARMIQDTKPEIIRDTIHMYKHLDADVCDYIIRESRNLEEMHNTFCACGRNMHLVNREIKYEDEEIARFNYVTTDGISFSLAESTKELAIIGAAMGICVGGYGDAAVRRYTTIVKAMQNDKYVACIEINGNDVVQLKAKYNNAVQLEYKHAVDEWAKHAKVSTDCNDYRNMGKPWGSNYNYAHINPNEFEEPDGRLRIVKSEHEPVKNKGWLEEGEDPCRSYGFIEYTPMDDDDDHDRF